MFVLVCFRKFPFVFKLIVYIKTSQNFNARSELQPKLATVSVGSGGRGRGGLRVRDRGLSRTSH